MTKTIKKKESADPRTMRDALAAQVLGDIDTLLDKLDATSVAVNGSSEKIQQTIRRLEEAGETYNQAVLAANMRSKKEMVAYLKTVTASVVSTTGDEQREVIRSLLREAISGEINTLKQALSESSATYRAPFITQWAGTIIIALITALITSASTVALIRTIG